MSKKGKDKGRDIVVFRDTGAVVILCLCLAYCGTPSLMDAIKTNLTKCGK